MDRLDTSILKPVFDQMAEEEGDDEFRIWVGEILDGKEEIIECVTLLLEGHGPGTYEGFAKGSFNLSYRIQFSDKPLDVIIRFPKLGHTCTALRDEKVENEVRTIEYLRQHTTIPLPKVYHWATTAQSTTNATSEALLKFGPFVIMEYVEGTLLSNILKQPDQEEMVFNPDLDPAIWDKVYRQLAEYMLQLSELSLPRIGAISKDDNANWIVRRPLTYNAHELVTVTYYPIDRLPITALDRASDYFHMAAKEHLDHLWIQRNLADDEEIARRRFIARHEFAKLIPKYCLHDTGPFIPFCDDLRPSNILVNPETLGITAVVDWEFTNSMPAQFAYDPPWWLLLRGPESWLDRDALEEFLTLYEPRVEQFLRALEQVEAESSSQRNADAPHLSARMRDSWRTRRFWFNYAARKGFDVDSVYWAMLHEDSETRNEDEPHPEMETFVQTKMEQLKAYDEECAAQNFLKEG